MLQIKKNLNYVIQPVGNNLNCKICNNGNNDYYYSSGFNKVYGV